MIDWLNLFENSLWVVGLAVSLAVIGIAGYQAEIDAVRLRDKLRDSAFQLRLGTGVILVCLGQVFGARTWWERAAWALLTAALTGRTVWVWKRRQDNSEAARQRTQDAQVRGRGIE